MFRLISDTTRMDLDKSKRIGRISLEAQALRGVMFLKVFRFLVMAFGFQAVPLSNARAHLPDRTGGSTSAHRQGRPTVSQDPAPRDDRGRGGIRAEPAMAGIPGDAVQRMPRVASPGLPPVDPVVAHRATGKSRSAEDAKARPPTAIGHDDGRPESVDRPSGPLESRVGPVPEIQPSQAVDVCPDVAGYVRGNPSEYLSGPVPAGGPSEGWPKDRNSSSEIDDGITPAAFSEVKSVACLVANVVVAKDEALDIGPVEAGENCSVGRMPDLPDGLPASPIDSRAGDRLPRAGTPAKRSARVPPRIADRPHVEEWTDDELLTLPEAAALFWPAGPITTNTLRTATRDGTLAITRVAGKFFTTPMAIRRMGVDEIGETARPTEAGDQSAAALFQMKLAEAKRLGGGRARSKRAAKRPVMLSIGDGAGR